MTDTKFRVERVSAPVATDEMLADLRRTAQTLNTRRLTQALYRASGRYHPTTLGRRFGSWNGALRVAGLDVAHEFQIAEERLLENLAMLWRHYGRQPRATETCRPPSRFSRGTYRRLYKTWHEALTRCASYMNTQGDGAGASTDGVDPAQPRGLASLSLRHKVMKRDYFRCRRCGASPAQTLGLTLHVDHITPRSRGGLTTIDNLQTLCAACNLGKGNEG